jgi:hypothetical protein
MKLGLKKLLRIQLGRVRGGVKGNCTILNRLLKLWSKGGTKLARIGSCRRSGFVPEHFGAFVAGAHLGAWCKRPPDAPVWPARR